MKFRLEFSMGESMRRMEEANATLDIATKFVDQIPGADGVAAEALREECADAVESTLSSFLHPGEIFIIEFDTEARTAVLVPVSGETSSGPADGYILQLIDRRLMELGLRPNT